MLIRPALREYRTWTTDSRRWAPYRPRPDDIIISAFSEIRSNVDATDR
jgi:aryl sulfotransferase